jgi:hypothetical protein
MLRSQKYIFFFIFLISLLSGCGRRPGDVVIEINMPPVIHPDYSDITIPPNIAPLNFIIREKGTAYFVKIRSGNAPAINIKSKNGIIRIPQLKWEELLARAAGSELNIDVFVKDKESGWKSYETITNIVSSEPVDPYLTYRLIHPGYERWQDISIRQRSIKDFTEWPVIENSVADRNCVNCHSYNNGKSDDFLFHMRGSLAGTYFYSGGELRKTNLKTPEMANGSVYPRWHPSGKFVAFSANKIVQQFHSADNNKIEVSDLESSLVLYDIDKNEIIPVDFPEKDKFMDTYPEWSPDGKMMYFCRAPRLTEVYDYRQTRYDLYRVAFDPESRKFGRTELVFDAAGKSKSISFPRVSPDGNYLVMTFQDYGCFPIWHKETDLISLNLNTLEAGTLDLNSDYPESYHSWSSNGRWLLFASRRDDGLTTRPYIAFIDETGKSGKPFILPQRDPEFYDIFLRSFNVPEFSDVKIDMNPGKIRDAVTSDAVQAKWGGN